MLVLVLILIAVAVAVGVILIADNRPRRRIHKVIVEEPEPPRRHVDLRDTDEHEVVERRETRRR